MKDYSHQIKQLGSKVKAMRESKQMTQQKLADACDVDIRTIQRFEIGEFGSGLPIIFAIAEAFETTPSELIDIRDIVL